MLSMKFETDKIQCFSRLVPEGRNWSEFQALAALGVVFIHLKGALYFYFLTPLSATLTVILFFFTGGLGITIGYHRFLAHQSFKTSRVFQFILASLGVLSFQCGPITWASLHRIHHLETDKLFDPHSPRVNFFWAHFFWTFFPHPYITKWEDHRNYANDLWRFPELRILDRWFLWINLVFLSVISIFGYILGGWEESVACFLGAGCLRIVIIWHLTFIVNSFNHLWGYRNYETEDNSRNSVLISLLVFFGEGWHNNHHAYPFSARHGHKWFEFDLAYFIIEILETLRVITNVRLPKRLLMKDEEVA